MPDPLAPLWSQVIAQFRGGAHSVHGPDHWRRVERNGLLLCTRVSGADLTVVRLFALFHDSRRVNDGSDHGHGARGAAYAASLRADLDLSDPQFELLREACTWHTDGHHHEDPTIGVCWDADRLDLGRVGVTPHARFMSTAFGRQIAQHGLLAPFLREAGLDVDAPQEA